MQIIVRDAVRDDADQVAATHIASWSAAYRHIFPDAIIDDRGFHESRYATWRGWTHSLTPDRLLRVAVLDGRVVGFALTGHTEDPDCDPSTPCGELIGFYAHPDAWGTGAARAMMDASLDHLRELGHGRAVLWTLRDAQRARAFYTKSGWTETGRSQMWERFPEHPVTQVEFEIPTPPCSPA